VGGLFTYSSPHYGLRRLSVTTNLPKITTNLSKGTHIFNRSTLGLKMSQQEIYLQIKQQKDQYVTSRSGNDGFDDEVIRDRPICTPSVDAQILADLLSQEQEYGNDPFQDIVDSITAATRPRDGWVRKMIRNQNKRIKDRYRKGDV